MNVADGTVDGHLGEGAPHSLMNGPKGNIVSQHFDAIGLAARYSEFRFNAILWKRGGHPPVARTMELARAAAELREIGGALELTHEAAPEMLIGSTLQLPAAHPAPGADAPLRRALLSGACLWQWGAHAAGSDESAAAERLCRCLPRCASVSTLLRRRRRRRRRPSRSSRRTRPSPAADR